MGEVVIRVDGLGKQYRIGSAEHGYRTLRDTLTTAAMRPVASLRSIFHGKRAARRRTEESIWALRDVSFNIRRGEVVGIVGRNGAGKSTLLKIISRITEPTAGSIVMSGRVGSLLEVGTGFHPELSGRDNIYLNGAILGMKRHEIAQKFDSIVAFAEVDKFIDTPVKHYSSGMHARLAFAVAGHMDPDILVVDEVLAVGDAAFQKKCLRKMGEVAQQGRTVLFVSHNLGQISRLCDRGLWLDQGRCMESGPIQDVTASYRRSFLTPPPEERDGQSGFLSWRILNSPQDSEGPRNLYEDGPFTVEFLFRLKRPVSWGHFGVVLQSAEGLKVAGWRLDGVSLSPGVHRLLCHFPAMPVRPGVYYWYVSLWDSATSVDIMHFLPEFVIATKDLSGMSEEWAGIVNTPGRMEVQALNQAETLQGVH